MTQSLVRFDFGNSHVPAFGPLRPHQVSRRAHRIAALFKPPHPPAQIVSRHFARLVNGRHGRNRLVATVLRFRNQESDAEAGVFVDRAGLSVRSDHTCLLCYFALPATSPALYAASRAVRRDHTAWSEKSRSSLFRVSIVSKRRYFLEISAITPWGTAGVPSSATFRCFLLRSIVQLLVPPFIALTRNVIKRNLLIKTKKAAGIKSGGFGDAVWRSSGFDGVDPLFADLLAGDHEPVLLR